MGAGAGFLGVVAPDDRECRIDQPILVVNGIEMADRAKLAFVDQLLGQGDGGHAAVIEGGHVDHSRIARGVEHPARLVGVARDRLFAQDVLAGLGGGDGDRHVRGVGSADIDHPDVVALDHLLPRSFGCLPSVARLEGGQGFGVDVARGAQHGPQRRLEAMRDIDPGVGVRAAHEAEPHQADVDCLGHRDLLVMKIAFALRRWINPGPGFSGSGPHRSGRRRNRRTPLRPLR
ncbi:MAG: hypothetical protein BWZ10_01867 [candidate division BRC1 bacterium ADurb.BinA364]|nr:MAG: hypothetical protein BWZ10_01867 [candidate division BRC1 bacterium ADurb.BinA364]